MSSKDELERNREERERTGMGPKENEIRYKLADLEKCYIQALSVAQSALRIDAAMTKVDGLLFESWDLDIYEKREAGVLEGKVNEDIETMIQKLFEQLKEKVKDADLCMTDLDHKRYSKAIEQFERAGDLRERRIIIHYLLSPSSIRGY